jgi:hypothetical protein
MEVRWVIRLIEPLFSHSGDSEKILGESNESSLFGQSHKSGATPIPAPQDA